MTTLALALVLASALIHTGWNLLVKRSEEKLLFTWLFLVASVILFAPVAIWLVLQGEWLNWTGFACVAGTTVAYGGYFTLLARSYRFGAVSLSYPIARSVAPLATVAWGVVLLGERPSPAGLAGIGLIVVAAVLLSLPDGLLDSRPDNGRPMGSQTAVPGVRSRRIGAPFLAWRDGVPISLLRIRVALGEPGAVAVLSAVGTGLFSSAYSAIDKVGVSLVHPALYIHLTFLGSVIVLWPLVRARYSASKVIGAARESLWPVIGAGAGSLGGYLLVLFALQQAPVSYVVPIRSTSILFTVLLGGWALREGKLLFRLPLAFGIVAGVILISWRG